MTRTRADLGVGYVRFHGILSDDMGTLLIERDASLYSFANADQIFDFLLGIGMRPFVELSFMPSALASGQTTVFSYKANVTPPSDLRKWSTLIRKLVAHWVDRYGVEEVRQWFFEVWNEPNLSAFWTGTQADYFDLYGSTAHAIKGVDGELRVGGPATANDAWIGEFLEHCEKHHQPVDFVSTHHYPTDALGKPGDDTEQQLAAAHRDILRERTEEACRAAGDKPVYYTEWSSSSNPFFHRHDEPYAAAFVVKNMLDVADLVHGYSFWTFSDIFSENYFSSVPFHGGFGLQTIHGIAKPAYRALQILKDVGAERLQMDGSHATVDSWVQRDEHGGVTVLLTNHAFPRHAIRTQEVTVTLSGRPATSRLTVERVDDGHCNAKQAWKDMGSPEYPDGTQLAALARASELVREPLGSSAHDGAFDIRLTLPPHSIVAVRFQTAPGAR
jgi:xylan 1,4-beta-xylosidase